MGHTSGTSKAAMNTEKAHIQKTLKMIQILLIGDSISEGYTPFVKDFFAGNADVHRPNENCGSTHLGLEKLDAWLGETRWDVIHFNWGLHDLRCVEENGEFVVIPTGIHFVPLTDYEENLRSLVGRLKQTGAKLIWCTSTPVPKGCFWRVENDEVRFNEVAARVMRDENIPVSHLHEAVSPRLLEFQKPNDVHFNVAGSAFMGKKVFEAIKRLI